MRNYFGLDDEWARPGPGRDWWRRDALVALSLFALSAFGVEVLRATGAEPALAHGRLLQYLSLVSAAALLFFRRKAPVLIMVLLTGVHFTLAGTLLPETAMTLGSQILYFMGMLSAFAWARDRRLLLIGSGLVLVAMATWLVWDVALGNSLDRLAKQPATGLVSPVLAATLWTALVNTVYFAGAIVGGQTLWHKARADSLVREQHDLLALQTEQLARQAVQSERLRIARELHDVVAHHVSLIGVQAGAARRNLEKHPEQASLALANIESSSREAVSEMRTLLRALRSVEDDSDEHQPTPDLTDLDALFSEVGLGGLTVDYELVAPGKRVAELPGATSTTLYRIVQEALSNVRAHSTADRARVVIRIGETGVEAEITDSGRPRSRSGGSGFGLRGIRERIEAVGGQAEIGPRPGGGFRVRVIVPGANA